MIATCDDCPEWAQWIVRSPIRGLDPADKEKKRTIILGWKQVAKLCGRCKLKMEAAPQELELHFAFTGASVGTANS